MKYWDRVKVTSWFYEGIEFTIIGRSYWTNSWVERYILAWNYWIPKFVNYNSTIEEMTFDESSLELIK